MVACTVVDSQLEFPRATQFRGLGTAYSRYIVTINHRYYGTRSPLHEHTLRIKTILKVPDATLNI